MLYRNVLLVAVLALGTLEAWPVPVRVALEWPAGTPTSARVHLRAIQMAGNTTTAAPVENEATQDGIVLELPVGVWQVQAYAAGYWSQEAEVTVDRQLSANVRLALWPAASVRGEIQTTGGEPLPPDLEVRLDAVPDDTTALQQAPRPSPSRAKLRCGIEQGTWNCLAPAGLFDLTMYAAGYTPNYDWGVSLKPLQSTYLGRADLRRAASVYGRAVRSDGSKPRGPCRATLQTKIERRGASEPDQESAPTGETSLFVPVNQRGYFQVTDVPPGKYVLLVDCPAASGFREVRVQANEETRIDPPLLLEGLTLDIAVTPAVDPEGKPWLITVDQTAPRLLQIVDKGTTPADGHFIWRGLTAGNYRVTVSGSDGSLWLQRYFNLGAGSRPLLLRLSAVRVTGLVLLSSRPVRARLVFSNDSGGESTTLTSDDNGRFRGQLPVAVSVQESRWTVEAHVAHPRTNRIIRGVHVVAGATDTWLDLELPTIAVHGSVVSEDGRSRSGIQVTFEDSRGNLTTTGTDNAGRFQMPDLPPGKYTALADSPEGVSDRMPFEVAEGSERELKLIIHPSMRVPFYVVSSDGFLSDAAVQIWVTPGVPLAFTRTDQNGRFEVCLSSDITQVGLTVGAPGYALKLLRMPISNDSKIDQPSDANTIRLDRSGGTLALKLNPPDRTLDSSSTLYLVHKGAIQDARTVAGWGTEQAGNVNDEMVVVESIEPGDYALCVVNGPADLSAIWQGVLPSNRCRIGSVEDGRTVTLSPP